ncbi:hypothetical protein K449DRAFT_438086 [Hypoxylon sp. EC38]|nr:hypothetical protein K449DRAFT_438086 [Hypoxylon sp. EC38]
MDSQPEASKRTARKRSSTESSYYDFHGTPCNESNSSGQDWMYAWEARAQVLRAPGRVQNPYPSTFHSHPIEGYALPLQASAPVLHYPLIPGQKTPWNRRGNVPTASSEPSPFSSQESTPDDSDSSDDLPDLIPADPYSFSDLPDWDRQSGKESLRQYEPQMEYQPQLTSLLKPLLSWKIKEDIPQLDDARQP